MKLKWKSPKPSRVAPRFCSRHQIAILSFKSCLQWIFLAVTVTKNMPQLPRGGWKMELLDPQQHKTTIYITTGFTAGFMILLTCLSEKLCRLKPRHSKNILRSVRFSTVRDGLQIKWTPQPSSSFWGCTVCYWIICWQGDWNVVLLLVSYWLKVRSSAQGMYWSMSVMMRDYFSMATHDSLLEPVMLCKKVKNCCSPFVWEVEPHKCIVILWNPDAWA